MCYCFIFCFGDVSQLSLIIKGLLKVVEMTLTKQVTQP